jgi:hypothetical protein
VRGSQSGSKLRSRGWRKFQTVVEHPSRSFANSRLREPIILDCRFNIDLMRCAHD